MVVPPEYRKLGCLPPEQFVPQLMVAVAKNRKPIRCGSVEVDFVARKGVARVPRTTVNIPRGTVSVSSMETTALDLVGYPVHVGDSTRPSP
jgi:hypothetical protein